MNQEVIYEVRLEIDADVEQEFDDWLGEHIAEMLCIDGFLSAEIRVPTDTHTPMAESTDAPDSSPLGRERVVRLVQYHVKSHEFLENYFNEHAHRMRELGVQRFGTRFSATRATFDLGVNPARLCLNCHTPLRSQYCEQCGQRDRRRGISLWELVRDLVGDLFEFDSRVWRTLRPLLFKPGLLTMDYLRGRRVHYTPPLRLYLITSLIFFLVIFFNADTEISFTNDGDKADLEATVAALEKTADEMKNGEANDLAMELDALARDLRQAAATNGDINDASAGNDAGDNSEGNAENDPATDTESGLSSVSDKCDDLSFDEGRWSEFIGPRAKLACRKLTADGGTTKFLRDLIDNAPAMMFVFLPVIALVMLFLYPFSKRYYVEHLLFFVHYHSFFFLILALTVLFSRLPIVFAQQETLIGLLEAVVTFYIPIYLFVAMRRVYGQSFKLTALKYVVLGVAYFISLLFSFTTMAFLTALSV